MGNERRVITHSSQIEELPWCGSFLIDSVWFTVIDDYIFQPTTSVEERVASLYAMGLYGMGTNEAVTHQQLAEYMGCAADSSILSFDLLQRYLSQMQSAQPWQYPVKAGTPVKLVATGEPGYIARGGKDANDPVIVKVGRYTTTSPFITFIDHSQLMPQAYFTLTESPTTTGC